MAVLIDGIITNRPFDALCAAARFWTVPEHVEHVVCALPDDRRVSALHPTIAICEYNVEVTWELRRDLAGEESLPG